jgi:hypothetical protein
MNPYDTDLIQGLPEHDRVLKSILKYFYHVSGTEGAFLSGSTVSGSMDRDSDLDIGILCKDTKNREKIWTGRWEWSMAPWFHRFDADHIKPYFVIYLFEPAIKADINLYVESDLPPRRGGPYRFVWDDSDILRNWQVALGTEIESIDTWRNVLHEEERYWAWLFCLYGRVNRGEYYNGATEFPVIRNIYEQWMARLAGETGFTSRRVEKTSFFSDLTHVDLFPKPNRESLKEAMLTLTRAISKLKTVIEKKHNVEWKTSAKAIEKISSLVECL